MKPHLQCCIHLWGPQFCKDVDVLEQVQRRAMEVVRGMENLSYKADLRELGLLMLGKALLRDLTVALWCLERAYKKDMFYQGLK